MDASPRVIPRPQVKVEPRSVSESASTVADVVPPTAIALTAESQRDGGHALSHFLAMDGGGVLGGLLFVAL